MLTTARLLNEFVAESLDQTTSADTGKEMAKNMEGVKLRCSSRKGADLKELGIWPADDMHHMGQVFPSKGRYV